MTAKITDTDRLAWLGINGLWIDGNFKIRRYNHGGGTLLSELRGEIDAAMYSSRANVNKAK